MLCLFPSLFPNNVTPLGLIKKMVQYSSSELLIALCANQADTNLGTLLVEVVASVLDNEVI